MHYSSTKIRLLFHLALNANSYNYTSNVALGKAEFISRSRNAPIEGNSFCKVSGPVINANCKQLKVGMHLNSYKQINKSKTHNLW